MCQRCLATATAGLDPEPTMRMSGLRLSNLIHRSREHQIEWPSKLSPRHNEHGQPQDTGMKTAVVRPTGPLGPLATLIPQKKGGTRLSCSCTFVLVMFLNCTIFHGMDGKRFRSRRRMKAGPSA